jgi:hypothetical protein
MERANPFGTVDGGFVAEDPNPFKEKPKSNNVLEMKPTTDDDDGFDEEPVKKTVKKAAVNSPSSGDLNDIVDSMFDDDD